MEVEKPDPMFFNKMIDEAYYLGIFKNEILFIDDKDENLQSAKNLGLITMNYNNEINNDSLYDAIKSFISNYENSLNIDMKKNQISNTILNYKANRPKNILINKLKNQEKAKYNEFCTVGAIPVLNTYGFKPTEPNKPPLEALKELRNESFDQLFSEEMLISLSQLEVPFNKDDLYPVYILLSYGATTMGKIIKKATKEPYSHGSISFDSKLNSLYSFTNKGFVHENIRDKNTYGSKENYKFSLYTIFVNEKQLKVMDSLLSSFITNFNKLSYSIKGCINNLFNRETHTKDKYFCSQFVAEMIKQANATVVKKDPSLYTPYDLRKIKGCFFISKGYLKNYNYKAVDEKTNMIKNKIEMNSIRNEAFSSPLSLSKNNDLILRYKKIDYKEEYNKSHRLLKIYSKTDDLESMKEELAKLWSYYLIIEELFIQKAKKDPSMKETKDYKEAVQSKAFILGDIKTYLEFISKKDKKFNFAQYYSDSKYNKDTILITKNDIKKIISLIKEIL